MLREMIDGVTQKDYKIYGSHNSKSLIHIGTDAPSKDSGAILWIDTNTTTGGLKYCFN
jgi:hypothetical protein